MGTSSELIIMIFGIVPLSEFYIFSYRLLCVLELVNPLTFLNYAEHQLIFIWSTYFMLLNTHLISKSFLVQANYELSRNMISDWKNLWLNINWTKYKVEKWNQFFSTARAADPDAELIINDYDIARSDMGQCLLDLVKPYDIDYIGVQVILIYWTRVSGPWDYGSEAPICNWGILHVINRGKNILAQYPVGATKRNSNFYRYSLW